MSGFEIIPHRQLILWKCPECKAVTEASVRIAATETPGDVRGLDVLDDFPHDHADGCSVELQSTCVQIGEW